MLFVSCSLHISFLNSLHVHFTFHFSIHFMFTSDLTSQFTSCSLHNSLHNSLHVHFRFHFTIHLMFTSHCTSQFTLCSLPLMSVLIYLCNFEWLIHQFMFSFTSLHISFHNSLHIISVHVIIIYFVFIVCRLCLLLS